MGNSCGYSHIDPSSSKYFQPPIITSFTNTVEIYFHTNDKNMTNYENTKPGWSLAWTALTAETVNVGQVKCGKVKYQCKMVVAHKEDCTIVSKVTPKCSPKKSKCTKGVLVSITTASGCTVTGKYKNTGKKQIMSQLTISGSGA